MINKDELVSKLKNIGNKSIEKSTELKNKSVKYGKRLIRKKAIENIREKLDFAQKYEKDFTKEQMLAMIKREEEKIIKNYKVKGALTTILAFLGITNIQMFKFLTKQFLYGRIYLWIKDHLSGLLFLFISIFLINYFHNEYLKYIEFKNKISNEFLGASFIIKNILIVIVAIAYYYFYFVLQKNKEKIEERKITEPENKTNNSEMVNSLDDFLEDDDEQKG